MEDGIQAVQKADGGGEAMKDVKQVVRWNDQFLAIVTNDDELLILEEGAHDVETYFNVYRVVSEAKDAN